MTSSLNNEHNSTTTRGAAELSSSPWNGRSASRLSNGSIALHILHEGGVLAALGRTRPDGSLRENVLWESPWMEPEPARDEKELVARFGDLGVGRFLDNFTGHALCLDGFGPATTQEVERGGGLHGEASLVRWEFLPSQNGVHARADLPLAGVQVERRFELLPGETVVRVRERVTDTAQRARSIQWVQHATVGQPFFDASCLVSTSATRGMTWAHGYEGCDTLQPSAKFEWPFAPAEHGPHWNLRNLFGQPASGFVAALLQPALEHGYVAALNPARQLALLYIFPTAIFPWVTLWEENRCRRSSPWNGAVQARGLEFGTTPLPVGRDASRPLLGQADALMLGAGQSCEAPWIMAIAEIPSDWSGIDEVQVRTDELLLRCGTSECLVRAQGIAAFLRQHKEGE